MLAVSDDAVHQTFGSVSSTQLSEFKATLVVRPLSPFIFYGLSCV